MAIREDLVASAAQFLQDPSVASSPIEKRVAFLQAKNLTQEEVSAALARVGSETPSAQAYTAPSTPSSPPSQPPYFAQYAQQYPPYAWQPPPPEVPRRDWRDWFIMATVVGGVSYGLYNLGKRYVYPLVAPPTPERLEQDKKSIDDQFEKTFALVEQVAKDTEALKATERERTQRLDTALSELETVLSDLKMSNRRRDDDAQRIRDDVQNLKDSIPRALGNQKEVTDARLREINTELKSLKTLLAQRMNSSAGPAVVGGYLRSGAGNATPTPGSAAGGSENIEAEAATSGKAPSVADEQPPKRTEYPAVTERKSPFVSGMAASGAKASIPAWQLAMAKGSGNAAATTNGAASTSEADAGGSSVQEAAGSP